MKFLSLDSPLMKALGRMADLMWLNLLTVICSIPIVTAGASFTALHYVCLKMVRDEEGYVTKDFFKSFKENFKQATIIWILILVIGAVLAFDFRALTVMDSSYKKIIFGAVVAATVFVIITTLYVFPILSHFVNTIKGTIRNAFFMSILALPRTALMLLLQLAPAALLFLALYFQTAFWIIPLVTIFAIAVPAYFCAKLYNKTFKRFEPEATPLDDYAWSVNKDSEEGEASSEAALEDLGEEKTEE